MNDWFLRKRFNYKGREVRYDVVGSGPAVVCVHGTPWSSYNLRHIIKGLSSSFRVFFYDLMGYGQSSKDEGDVSLGVQNMLLDALLDHWELEKPMIVGHDFGGATTLRTHYLNSRSFSKIVLIDPVALSPWGSPFFKHVNTYEKAFAGVPTYIHEAIVRAYVQTAAFFPLEEKTLNRTLHPWLSEKGQAAFYRQIAQANSSYTDEVQPFYSNIDAPTLILWGKEDSWIPVSKGEELHHMVPNSIFKTIQNAGHLVIEEKPHELINEIIPFLMVP